MEEEGFSLIALKVGEYCIHGRRVLKETKPYYFTQGYEIIEDGTKILVDESACIEERVYNDYLREKIGQGNHVPQVSIHAIVGKNGSGKSSLVEMMIRLLNNFAAILFGEQITDGYTAHLHYIDGIQGELYYIQGYYAYRLSICGRSMSLDRYERKETADTLFFEKVYDKHLGEIAMGDLEPILEDLGGGIEHYIEAFFYTIVSNYSIYAYNTLDYPDENVSVRYEKKILKEKFGKETKGIKVNASSRNWLHGLFHKNDGYKTPLVLTPFRDEGKIDINVENTLSRERFISLLLMSNDETGSGFRTINGHLEVKGFDVKQKGDYNRTYINKNVNVTEISDKKYQELRIYIFTRWDSKLFGDDSPESLETMARSKRFGDVALNYLLYKTIKVCTKYRIYEHYQEELENYLNGKDKDNEFLETLDDYFDSLIENRSHITRKIRQTLAYLLTPANIDVYEQARGLISVSEMASEAQAMVKYVGKQYMYDFYVRDIEDMIPPPFLDVKIQLKNLDDDNTRGKIAFETLSSGEKQQIYSISSILYHLMNINSVEEDKSSSRYCYHYVNIVLEEIELYFHPDFQKRYITMILDGLAQIKLDSIYGVNFCFVTHSPFVLSDIPKGNLLALDKGKSVGKEDLKTFGANIYDMLRHSFFLEGTPIGSYAQWVITRVITALRVWQYLKEKPKANGKDIVKMVSSPKLGREGNKFLQHQFKDSRMNDWDVSSFKSKYNAKYLFRLIDQIDEPLVHNSLLREYYEVFPEEYDKAREIAMLENRLAELKES